MIDPKLLALLPDAEQVRVRNFEILFASPAWAELVKFITEAKDLATARLINAGSWEETCFQKGAAAAYQDLLAAQDRVATIFMEAAVAVQQEKVDADEDAELDYE